MFNRVAAQVSYVVGLVALRVGGLSAAANLFDQVLKAMPDHVGALKCSGQALARLGRFQDSLRQYERLKRLLPSNADALLGIAIALQQLGQHRDAIAAFTQALDANPENSFIAYNLAVSLSAAGRLQDALVIYRRLARLYPNDPDAAGNLAAVFGDLGHWTEAFDHAKRAMALRPDVIHARNLGIAAFECREYAVAADAFRAALAFAPSSEDVQIRLGSALAHDGKAKEAMSLLEKVLTKSPENPAALSAIVAALILAKREKQALDVAVKFTETHPILSLAHETCGWAYLQTGNAAEALRAYERAISLSPDAVELHAGRGVALSLAGQHAKAVDAFTLVLNRVPDYLDKYPDLGAHFKKSLAASRR